MFEIVRKLKAKGFSYARLGALTGKTEGEVRKARRALDVRPVFKRIDTCAAEFEAKTPYMYSTYEAPSFGTPEAYGRVSGNRSRADDYRDGAGRVVPSAWDKWSADAAFGWTPDADTVIELGAGRGETGRQSLGAGAHDRDQAVDARTQGGTGKRGDFASLADFSKQFVAAEDVNKPLSDNQIAEMLKEQGIECARRTVAKYREALKIAPANLRKAL